MFIEHIQFGALKQTIYFCQFRSAEKTDYTYAKSYSYRTEVTPERVICMPNMTRRSIERCHGEGFSSPELKSASSQSLLMGKASGIKAYKDKIHHLFLHFQTGLNISYRKDHDSDLDLDDNETYQLKTPINNYGSKAYLYTSNNVDIISSKLF